MRFQQLLLDGAARRPERTALHWVDRDRRLTYAEAAAGMERVAGALAALGVKKGDRVGIFAHNGIDYVLAMFGAWRLGAISAHVNVQYADTLDYYLADCTPSVLIYTGDHYPTIQRHRAAAKSVKHYICMDGPQEGALAWADLLEHAPPAPSTSVLDHDGAHLSYTSGSTGKPKGALLAHEPTFRACRSIAERLGFNSRDLTYGPSTLSSSYHLVANLIPGLFAGATVVADLAARAIVVSGKVKGSVTGSTRVELKSSAKVEGDITAPKLVLEDGATLMGKVDTGKK